MTINLTAAFKAIDKANSQDPNNELIQDVTVPKELIYGQRMSARLDRFCPDSSVALQLAARCQHIERWKIPRSNYPQGRQGYKRWRTELAKFHAKTAAKILDDSGIDRKIIDRVEYMLQKKGLKRDQEVQTLEDVICLVFLEYYLEPFSAKHSEEKLIAIIQKTWRKMSEKGREAALKLSLNKELKTLISKALEA